jgi:hypothetical protein
MPDRDADTQAWHDWVEARIATAIEREHEFVIEILKGMTAQLTADVGADVKGLLKDLKLEI